jgi:hypothetical protein
MTLTPTVVAQGDPGGLTTWTVTLTDNNNATASQSFTVTYTPLTFTNLTPPAITTTVAPYTATLTATGSNFTNLQQIEFTLVGADPGGPYIWQRGSQKWNQNVTINSDGSMTLTPTVVAQGDPVGLTTWTVTLTDSSNATASQSFTVTYSPTGAFGYSNPKRASPASPRGSPIP